MKKIITVEQALKRGHQLLTIPVVMIIVIVLVISFYLSIMGYTPAWFAGLSIPIGGIISLFYWCNRTVKWRLWAFENVRNVHELKRRAIQEDLLQQKGNFSEKFEFWTGEDKYRWNLLESKFKMEDIFVDDPNISEETIIINSSSKNLMELVATLFCFGFGVFTILKTESLILGIVLTLIGLFFSYKCIIKMQDKTPKIRVNEKGIETTLNEFTTWEEIRNEKIIREYSRKQVNYYLVYKHSKGQVKLNINGLNLSRRKLDTLLIVYRGRFENRQKNN